MHRHHANSKKYRSRSIINARRDRRFAAAKRSEQKTIEIDDFVQNIVAPWVSQSRISQLIADDFEGIGGCNAITTTVKKL